MGGSSRSGHGMTRDHACTRAPRTIDLHRSPSIRPMGRPSGRPDMGFFPMNRSMVANRWNLDLIEENHQRWRNDPASVDETWRIFFEGYELGHSNDGVARDDVDQDAARAQASVTRLVDAYREIGHYLADLDPLKLNPRRQSHEMLDLEEFGLSEADL